jgi:uncharacterized membrane protein (UPF0182 family)
MRKACRARGTAYAPGVTRFRSPLRRPLGSILPIAALALVVWLLARLWIEWHWFAQFALERMLLRRWALQLLGAGVGGALCWGLEVWLGNLWRLPRDEPRRFPLAPAAYAGSLLLLALGQILPCLLLLRLARRLLLDPFVPTPLVGMLAPPLSDLLPLMALALGALMALLWRPLGAARVMAAVAAVAASLTLARGWGLWSLALVAPDAGLREPMLGADVSFGLVRFPALVLGLSLLAMLAVAGLSCGLWGLLARPPQLSDGRFAGFSPAQLRALRRPLGLLALLAAGAFWLGRHQLLLSTAGSVPGAGWLDIYISLPLRTLASLLALALAVAALVRLPRQGLRGPALLISGGLLLLVPLFEALLLPLLQLIVVKPRELEREAPYLARSIRATREAFQLNRIVSRNVNPRARLTRADVEESRATLRNIRLWDSQPLLATNQQLQKLRVYYRFSEPAVDRYDLGQPRDEGRQLVMITAREIDPSALPPASRTWLNRHLVFTHGMGFTVSPVNTKGPDGLPEYFISDLGRPLRIAGSPQLGIRREQVEAAIPIGRPSLYFGALPSPYAIAPTRVQEFDYPQGGRNIYTHYTGSQGVPVGQPLQRLAAAIYLGEPKLISRGALTSRSKLLLRRDVRQRLRTLTPFVRFTAEPYLVSVAVGEGTPFPSSQHQYWIVDGFTVSHSYPYSAAVPGHPEIRYLRNAVKAVVDAYNGTVRLYVSEPRDPIIAGWWRLFPDLFEPMAAMPRALRTHVRYPIRQFELQTAQLLRYHVTDPRIFYSGDDVWQVPKEVYGQQQVSVRPYHISAQLSPQLPPEFLLLQPLTPLARPNLAAWLAARSDDPHYGQLVLLRFPSQTTIFGPEQITALINQDPVISQQFGLWNRSGAEVIEGNLLVVPVGEALLYVEPIYLRARQGGLPTLARVVVSDGTRIVMERSLEQGIEALLAPARTTMAPPQEAP